MEIFLKRLKGSRDNFKKILMKTVLILFSFIFCLFSCTEEVNLDYQDSTDLPQIEYRETQNVTTIVIKCRGNCGNETGGDDQCPMSWDMNNDIIRCDCAENCKMILSNSYTKPLSGSLKNSIEFIADSFLANRENDFITKSIEITIDEQNLFEFIRILFEENSELNSTGYTIQYEANGDGTFRLAATDPVWEVDCSGSCNASDDICTEEWYAQTGKVRCSCEGDGCKMKIKKVDQ